MIVMLSKRIVKWKVLWLCALIVILCGVYSLNKSLAGKDVNSLDEDIGNNGDVETIISVSFEESDPTVEFIAANKGKEPFVTTEICDANNQVLIVRPSGEAKSVLLWSGSSRKVVINPSGTRIWRMNVSELLQNFSEEGLYRVRWKMEGLQSARIGLRNKPNDMLLRIAGCPEKGGDVLAFLLTNRGKEDIVTTPLATNYNRIVVVRPDGKKVEIVAWKKGVRPIIVKPGETMVWERDLGEWTELDKDGLYSIRWRVGNLNPVFSSEYLLHKGKRKEQ